VNFPYFSITPDSFKLLSISLIFARTDMSVLAPPFLKGREKFKVPENGALLNIVKLGYNVMKGALCH